MEEYNSKIYPDINNINNINNINKTDKIVKNDISRLTIPHKTKQKQKQKDKIPKALREQVWIQNIGKKFETECPTKWCKNRINPFDFHVGHNIPEAKGGTLNIDNLKPICSRCNLSMNTQYTIDGWNNLSNPRRKQCTIM